MARPPKAKKPANPKTRKRYARRHYIEKLAEQYINLRYSETAEGHEMEERVVFHMHINQNDACDAELCALYRPMRWEIVTVTICKSPIDGKEYHLISHGITNQPFVAWRQGITPLVTKLFKDSERNMNVNHCVARATLFTPVCQGNINIADLVKPHMKRLRLKPETIEAIRELSTSEPDAVLSVQQFDDLELDDKLIVLFREQELENGRMVQEYSFY